MKRLLGLGLTALILAGCQTTASENKAPICSGKHRRPMNIYPSILTSPGTSSGQPAPVAAAAEAPVAAVQPATAPEVIATAHNTPVAHSEPGGSPVYLSCE